jgi:hypothetical protein
MAALLNRARMSTATTGTGTITLGSAVAGYATFAEASAVDATVYSYCIEDGDDFEIGVGTYTSSGTTFSRDTVTVSKISGTAGTSKINLSGSAEIFITARADDLSFSGSLSGTSTTSLTIEIASKVFTTQAGKGWTVGQRVRAASDDGTKVMEGPVTTYSGTSLTIDVDYAVGSGTHADWNISVTGEPGLAVQEDDIVILAMAFGGL